MLTPLAAARAFDAVVLDLYTGLDAPAFVDEPAFMVGCLALLSPDGLLAVNVADAAGLARLRAQVRALARADPGAALLVAGDPTVLSGAEEGNAVLVAAPGGLPPGLEDRLALGGPFPCEVLTGHLAPDRRRAVGRVLSDGGSRPAPSGCRSRLGSRARRVAWHPCPTSNAASP